MQLSDLHEKSNKTTNIISNSPKNACTNQIKQDANIDALPATLEMLILLLAFHNCFPFSYLKFSTY